MLAAEPVAGGDPVLQRVHRPLVLHVSAVAPVVVRKPIHVANHVRRDSGAFDRQVLAGSQELLARYPWFESRRWNRCTAQYEPSGALHAFTSQGSGGPS